MNIMKITQAEFDALPEGGVVMMAVQKCGGEKIGLKTSVNSSYDWDDTEYNAIELIKALKKCSDEVVETRNQKGQTYNDA